MKARSRLVVLFTFLVAQVLNITPLQVQAADPPPQPTNISCQGTAATTVRLFWKDNASDETNYIVERRIGGGAFSVLATLGANVGFYDDTTADTSNQNNFYRVKAFRSGDTSSSIYSSICNNRRITATSHFRLFYGLRGTSDACPLVDTREVCLTNTSSGGNNVFITRQTDALEGTLSSLDRVGFAPGSAGTPPSGLDKIPINVVWCDGGGCAGGGGLGLSPFLLEKPFDLATRVGDPAAWIVALHEVFHFQQYQYPGLADPADGWVYEGQARSVQDKLCLGPVRSTCPSFDDINTGYAGYVPELMGYLANPSRSINRTDYQAALFWTYLTEKFGTSAPGDTVEGGMNLMVKFWEAARDNPGSDGITALNKALQGLGYSARFRDIWKDFAVANYAKNLTGVVPAKYTYADMAQPGGTYGSVALSLNTALANGSQFVRSGENVAAWGARYYELRPAADVPVIDIKLTQDSVTPVYYTILAIRGQDIVYEFNQEARNLNQTLINNAYDRVVVIVAGLDQLANYRYSFNGTRPTLRIASPTTSNPARVGNPAAPDKFRIAVEVIGADGTPLTGVDLTNFSFRVGTVDLTPANILTSAHIQNQQWFVVRAPGQTAAGAYDLLVRYGSILSDTALLGVNYTPRLDADSILTVDRSGSMLANNKLEGARAAARLYVDSYRSGDQIGVTSFNQTVVPNLGLTAWTDTPAGGSRQTALNAINGFVAGGDTALGDALRASWNSLKAAGNINHDWAIVFLSDGQQTTGTEQFPNVISALRDDTAKKPVVHAIALGPDADQALMQRAAYETGGTYQFVSLPATPLLATPASLKLDLDLRYRSIATEVAGQQQIFSITGPLPDGDPFVDTVQIPVENGAAELFLSLSLANGQVSATLLNPGGIAVAPFHVDALHTVYRVASPQGGIWKLQLGEPPPVIKIVGADATPQGTTTERLPAYLVHAVLRSDVTMDAALPTPLSERRPGVAMPIVVGLTDTAPILGAIVHARVTSPDNAVHNLTLFDDGNHNDGAAGDGIYGATIWRTALPGSYSVFVEGQGTSPLNGPFTREKLLGFFLQGTGDPDNDGLDSAWETTFGTDPLVYDATADPDHDGSPNSDEATKGTDPHDSDSDDGGHQDGGDPDPRNPADDSIQPTWAVAEAGVGKILIRYANRPTYTQIQFWRSVGHAGPYTPYSNLSPSDPMLVDTAVVNGTEYCYFVIASDAFGRKSAALDPSCATPLLDPYPPNGWVLINNGAAHTSSRNVTLNLSASDEIDPEHVVPGTEANLPPDQSATSVVEMLISNRPDLRDAQWEPYRRTKAWLLAQTSGLGIVYAKFRDTSGLESRISTATINIDRTAPRCVVRPATDLTGRRITDDIAEIHNRSTSCSYDVGIASYRRFDTIVDNQELHDWALATINPGETIRIGVQLPTCSAQVDVFYGSLLNSLRGQRYSDRLLASWKTGGAFCTRTAPPIPLPVSGGVEPQPPLALGSQVVATGSAQFHWQAALGSNIVGYQILRADVSGGPYALIGTTSSTSYTDPNAKLGVRAYYVIRAYNERGETSMLSSEIAINTTGTITYLPLVATTR